MELPFDVLDYIFGLLRSDPETLVECSKAHPMFSQILNRHLFYHIVIHLGPFASNTRQGYNLSIHHLIKLVSETPQLVDHVRVLEIQFPDSYVFLDQKDQYFEEFASILSTFSALKSIILLSEHDISWRKIMPLNLKTALESCLYLPTVQQVYVSILQFPLSLLGTNPNINLLFLSGWPRTPESSENHPCPQLKSLSVGRIYGTSLRIFSTWAKRHIAKLQFLKCDYADEKVVLELLEACSDTLEFLDLNLKVRSSEYQKVSSTVSGQVIFDNAPLSINLSSLSRLHHLTIRANVYIEESGFLDICNSTIAATVDILKTVSSSQLHLTIEIALDDLTEFFFKVDFTLFVILLQSPLTVHPIDLYVYFTTWRTLDYDSVVALLKSSRTIVELAERGVLVLHAQETAPLDSRFIMIDERRSSD